MGRLGARFWALWADCDRGPKIATVGSTCVAVTSGRGRFGMGLGLRRGVGRPGCRGFRNAAGSSDNQSRSPKATPKAKKPAFFSSIFTSENTSSSVAPLLRRCGPSRVQGHRNSPQRHEGPRRRARTPAAPATHPAAAPPRTRRAPSAPPAPSPEVRGGATEKLRIFSECAFSRLGVVRSGSNFCHELRIAPAFNL